MDDMRDTRLIEYDVASPEVKGSLATEFSEDSCERALFKSFAQDRLARALLEFTLLHAVPFEDFRLLCAHGLAECRGEFATYVPIARGAVFPDPQLTEKARGLEVAFVNDRGSEALIEGLILAYRARDTGQGIVAGRATLEEWIDAGNGEALQYVVDPHTGDDLMAWTEHPELLEMICDPSFRNDLVRARSCVGVAEPMTTAKQIHHVKVHARDHRKQVQ